MSMIPRCVLGYDREFCLSSSSSCGHRFHDDHILLERHQIANLVCMQSLVGMNSLVQNHKCCAHVSFINSWCQREKLWYALLLRANKPKTAVQSSSSFFSWHHMVFFLHVYALVGYGCLLASLLRPNPLCQYFEFGFWLSADLDLQEWGGA